MVLESTAGDEKMPPAEESKSDDASNERKWKSGDRVVAVWAGNGCYYGAVVNEVHHEKRTMTVLWDDQETTHQLVSFDQVTEPGHETRAWSMASIDRITSVRDTTEKGRCLFTNESASAGSTVFIEKPTLVVLPAMAPKIWAYLQKLHETQPLNLGTVTFHFAGLVSHLVLDPMSIDIIVDKFVPDPDEEPGEDVMRILASLQDDMHENLNLKERPIDPRHFQRLVSSWRYNSFGHHKEDGLVLYNRISMCAHSCDPSCCWSYGEEDAFVLRARVALNAGDELTVSYLQDEDLLKSTAVRRNKLQNWRFTCQCERCALPVDKGRGFRCRKCRIGVTHVSGNDALEPCTTCGARASKEDTGMLLKLEEEYQARVEGMDKTDHKDVQTVFDAALDIFEKHWILYVMDTYLWEARRESQLQEAMAHQWRRIEFHEHYYCRPTFILAWCHEEMGDSVQNYFPKRKWQYTQEYQKAYCMLAILCGSSHQYTSSPYHKLLQAQSRNVEGDTEKTESNPQQQ